MALLILACTLARAADQIQAFGHQWLVPNATEWRLDTEKGEPVLHLLVGHDPPSTGPRRPFQFAIADAPEYQNVTVEGDLRPGVRSMMIVFAYHDAAHFDYAHLSTDSAAKQPVHNGVFHVYGGERVRISAEAGPAAFSEINQWHHVVLNYSAKSGEVNVSVDGNPIPALHAVDLSLGPGKVGIGSFDETGDFKNIKITGR